MPERIPFVSVIIPTYNRADFVVQAVKSVLGQTFIDYEIMVVDDGSTDTTREQLSPFRKRINYIWQRNRGAAAARNVGILRTRGEWVAFLNSDDEWMPAKLAIQVRNMAQHPEACLHTADALLIDDNGNHPALSLLRMSGIAPRRLRGSLLDPPANLRLQLRAGIARISAMIVRRETLQHAGLFDERLQFYEDQDLACRLALEGRWMISDMPLVRIHRRNPDKQNLARQRLSEALRSFQILVQIYERLLANQKLPPAGQHLVINKLNKCRAGLGMELIKADNIIEARAILRQCIFSHPTPDTFCRYLISLSSPSLARWLVHTWQGFRCRFWISADGGGTWKTTA